MLSNGDLHLAVWSLLTQPNLLLGDEDAAKVVFPEGWTAESPRDELRPEFSYRGDGGPSGTGSFVIRHDAREGLDGWMQRTFKVRGNEYVRFEAHRKLSNVEVPRRSALVRVLWKDDEGKMVSANVSDAQIQELGHVPTAEPEHPVDGSPDTNGWTMVSGTYQVPAKATQAVVELHLQWAPNGTAEWSAVRLEPCAAPPSRIVRLATIHHQPSGKSMRANCEEYAPLIATAAERKADLVVLGETVPYVGVKLKAHETAEPIPGPTTDYFGELATQHQLYIVLSLYERDQHLVFNTAVLIGPDGRLVGKYRKVCLPHGEVENGIAPGREYPVFETRIGRVGMMVCYDGFFPEVARELTNRGAEIIAWPVWGCNPQLAKARAAENHVYIVSSTYMNPKDGWMLSAVYDPFGKPVAQADEWGSVAMAEVDLSRPAIGPYNLGDFHSMLNRHRPVQLPEPASPNAVDDSRVTLQRAFELLNSGKTNEAKVLFEKLVEQQPKDYGAKNGLARCLSEQGKADEAVRIWLEIEAAVPGVNSATGSLASHYMKAGKYQEAKPLLEKLIASKQVVGRNRIIFQRMLNEAREKTQE